MELNQLNEKILEYIRHRYFGKYRGKVTNNQDETNRGRLEVVVPAVLGDLKIWALPCMPFTGNGVGTYWLPDKDAGVWVEFEAGDCSYPVWTGGYWADKELPKDETSTVVNPAIRMIRSQKGMMLTMNDGSEVITISDKDGNNIITMDMQTGNIKITGNMKVVVNAPQIELVENALHPLVYGDSLIAYLNQLAAIYQSHTHPGELALGVLPITPAPPVPPFPPATPALLSTIVKTG